MENTENQQILIIPETIKLREDPKHISRRMELTMTNNNQEEDWRNASADLVVT